MAEWNLCRTRRILSLPLWNGFIVLCVIGTQCISKDFKRGGSVCCHIAFESRSLEIDRLFRAGRNSPRRQVEGSVVSGATSRSLNIVWIVSALEKVHSQDIKVVL